MPVELISNSVSVLFRPDNASASATPASSPAQGRGGGGATLGRYPPHGTRRGIRHPPAQTQNTDAIVRHRQGQEGLVPLEGLGERLHTSAAGGRAQGTTSRYWTRDGTGHNEPPNGRVKSMTT